MALQLLDLGSAPNDNTGDTGRDGGQKINDNFTELYRLLSTTRQTTTYTIQASDYNVFCNTDSAGFTATLPAGSAALSFRVINTGSSGNLLTVEPESGEDLIGVTDGAFYLYDGESLEIAYNATDGWY